MRNTPTLALAGLMMLAACGGSGGSDAPQEPPDEAYEAVGIEEVKKRLRDPESAVFEEVFVSRRAGVPAICGYVNSRNGFGGMSGRQRFIAGGNIAGIEEDFAEGEMDLAWARLCA